MSTTSAPLLDTRSRLYLSSIEAKTLTERDIHCPICNFKIQTVFSDATGHLSVKCQKCKNILILNLAYFRAKKPAHRRAYYKARKLVR